MAMIDSEKLYRRIAGHSKYSGDAILTAISCLAEGKEIHDVPWLKNYVEVVLCRDCTYFGDIGEIYNDYKYDTYFCKHYKREDSSGWPAFIKPNEFCSYGDRREDDD